MTQKRRIEVFSSGCPACEETIQLVNSIACPSCEVTVLDMRKPDVAKRAKEAGIHFIPAVVINGKLADCCNRGGVDAQALRAEGIGQPIP